MNDLSLPEPTANWRDDSADAAGLRRRAPRMAEIRAAAVTSYALPVDTYRSQPLTPLPNPGARVAVLFGVVAAIIAVVGTVLTLDVVPALGIAAIVGGGAVAAGIVGAVRSHDAARGLAGSVVGMVLGAIVLGCALFAALSVIAG